RPRPGTAVIRMNRPERMNSMAFELMVPLAAVLDEVDADNDITCVVLTGTGSGFCSGADTRDTMPPPNIDGLGLSGIATKAMATLADLVPRMRRMNKPIIAAINGAAIGGGMCLTLGADIRLAGESAYFRAAGINNGLTATELGLSFLLPRAVGSTHAFEFIRSGRFIRMTAVPGRGRSTSTTGSPASLVWEWTSGSLIHVVSRTWPGWRESRSSTR
ncbi:MAG: enoyl-CoA hydratase, partial [Actinobacteria bacterium]|nr:enoyl-CoA hydratase [Actinomycetota bacterium]